MKRSVSLVMGEDSISQLAIRIGVLERELKALRSQVVRMNPTTSDWLESVSGSMKSVPEDSYNEILAAGRAIVSGEREIAEEL